MMSTDNFYSGLTCNLGRIPSTYIKGIGLAFYYEFNA